MDAGSCSGAYRSRVSVAWCAAWWTAPRLCRWSRAPALWAAVATAVRRSGNTGTPGCRDIESGYGQTPESLIDGLVEVGAVGLNIEDTVHSEGGRLREAQEHADFVGRLRRAADAVGVHVVINARTDIFLRQIGDESDRTARAVARLALCAEAGADSLYPVGFHTDEVYRELVEALPLPVNAIADPATGDRAHLASLGVGRVSFGPLFQVNLAARATELLAAWR